MTLDEAEEEKKKGSPTGQALREADEAYRKRKGK